jgi:hypothetical protein
MFGFCAAIEKILSLYIIEDEIEHHSPYGLVVMIAAFQAAEKGSIPFVDNNSDLASYRDDTFLTVSGAFIFLRVSKSKL